MRIGLACHSHSEYIYTFIINALINSRKEDDFKTSKWEVLYHNYSLMSSYYKDLPFQLDNTIQASKQVGEHTIFVCSWPYLIRGTRGYDKEMVMLWWQDAETQAPLMSVKDTTYYTQSRGHSHTATSSGFRSRQRQMTRVMINTIMLLLLFDLIHLGFPSSVSYRSNWQKACTFLTAYFPACFPGESKVILLA